MMGRVALAIAALVAGIVAASFVPELSQSVHSIVGPVPGPAAVQSRATAASDRKTPAAATKPADDEPGILRMTQEQITAAGIELTTVGGGTLARRITVPGTIVPQADRIA
jgi:cobalt-zinc-cadmium efflux system membrane fusion protein